MILTNMTLTNQDLKHICKKWLLHFVAFSDCCIRNLGKFKPNIRSRKMKFKQIKNFSPENLKIIMLRKDTFIKVWTYDYSTYYY